MSQHLSRHGIQSRVRNNHFGVLARRFVVLEGDHSRCETLLELFREVSRDWFEELDVGEETVGGGS